MENQKIGVDPLGSDINYFMDNKAGSPGSDLMLASTSQIETKSPREFKQVVTAIGSSLGQTKERNLLVCPRCDYKTFHRHALDRHIQAVHEKMKLYQCQRCDYRTGHASALKRHCSKVHEKNSQMIFACEACDYHTIHKSALKRHVANRHEKESQVMHQCSVCEYRTTYEFALERHISTVHLKEGAFECSVCEYNTVHKHALDRHVRMVHEKPSHLSCDLCQFRTAHRSALKMHFATKHEAKDTFKCDKCGYETLYKTALHRHQTTVTCGQGEKVLGAGSLFKQGIIGEGDIEVKDNIDNTHKVSDDIGGNNICTSEMYVSNLPVNRNVDESRDSPVMFVTKHNLTARPVTSTNIDIGVLKEGRVGEDQTYRIAVIQRSDGTYQQVLQPVDILESVALLNRDSRVAKLLQESGQGSRQLQETDEGCGKLERIDQNDSQLEESGQFSRQPASAAASQIHLSGVGDIRSGKRSEYNYTTSLQQDVSSIVQIVTCSQNN